MKMKLSPLSRPHALTFEVRLTKRELRVLRDLPNGDACLFTSLIALPIHIDGAAEIGLTFRIFEDDEKMARVEALEKA